jgi:predicted TIM-barrel fold metal-dependent hydrolase
MAVEQKTYPHPHVNEAWLARLREDILEPELPIIDAHHHMWERASGVYLLPQLRADVTAGHNVRGTVYIQCGYGFHADGPDELKPVGETETVVRITAGAGPGICAGIVGYTDFRLGERVDAVLEAHIAAGQGRFRGIRQSAGWDPAILTQTSAPAQPGLLADPAFRVGIGRLRRFGLSYESSLYHPQLPDLAALARAFPEQPILANHCGGYIAIGPHGENLSETFQRWRAGLQELAACPNVYLKLGGQAMSIRGVAFHEAVVGGAGQRVAAGDGNVHRNVWREPLHVRE